MGHIVSDSYARLVILMPHLLYKIIHIKAQSFLPRHDGLVICMSAFHKVGHGFASQSGHTKDHHKNGTDCLHALHAFVRVGV